MGIRYANFTPISNHFARRRAPLCPLIKCYEFGMQKIPVRYLAVQIAFGDFVTYTCTE